MSISAAQVKDLRQATGVGMMDCKKALEETGGDMDKAIVWLREKGIAKAAKKVGRVAADGMTVFAVHPSKISAILLEINCETDFTAKNAEFSSFVRTVGDAAIQKEGVNSLESLKALNLSNGQTVEAAMTDLIARIGENMTIRRFERKTVPAGGFIAGYSHMGGKICTLVCFEGGANDPATAEAGADIAMHVAAAAPRFFDAASVPSSTIAEEESIARVRLTEEGKGDMIDKILPGQIKKFFKDVCLVEQPFVKEPKQSVTDYLKKSGAKGQLKSFGRFQLGEGVEVQKTDFASEVASVRGNF